MILVLVFVLQNLASATTTFFGARWTIPLGVDLLFAAVLGGLVVFLVGTTRMLQLRRMLRRAVRSGSDGGGRTKARPSTDRTQ